MNLSSVWTIVAILMMTGAAYGQAFAPFGPACAPTLPAGLLIRVAPDERIVAGQTDGPLMLTVTSDVRLFPAKPPVVPRSSKLFVRTIESKEAGRLWGRARYQMALESILTPEGCQYDLDAKLIEAGKYKIQQQAIIGKGHARRDFILWVFPPTTLYQLVRLPARGPKLVFDEESVLAIRLFQPVQLNEDDTIGSNLETAPVPVPSPPVSVIVQPASAGCADKPQPNLFNPLQVNTGIVRPVRNMTTYSVTVVIGKEVISRLGPCFGSMVTVPYGEFTVTAQATILGPEGQRQIPLDVVVNAEGSGWDIVEGIHDAASAVAIRPNPR